MARKRARVGRTAKGRIKKGYHMTKSGRLVKSTRRRKRR